MCDRLTLERIAEMLSQAEEFSDEDGPFVVEATTLRHHLAALRYTHKDLAATKASLHAVCAAVTGGE